MEIVKMNVNDIIPYENNPRINDDAVDAVIGSIEQCGYIATIIIDEEHVVLAGHTRLRALKALGIDRADCLLIDGLTDEQKKKYRLLDNKIAEYSEWDTGLLKEEIEGIDFGEISNLFDITSDNKKNNRSIAKKDKGVVICPRCGKVVVGNDGHVSAIDDEAMSGLEDWYVET